MTLLANNFEGGVDGVAISTFNSGGTSGDAFGAVTIDPTASLVFDGTQSAHGTFSAKVATGATSGSSYVAWTTGIAGTSPSLWTRAYMRLTANPSAAVNILRLLNSSNAIMGTVRINANGTVGMLYGSGTLGGTSVGAITPNAWFRIETLVTTGTTTGVMSCRIAFVPDAVTPDETLTSTNVNTGSTNPSRFRAGVVTNAANVTAINFDDLAASDVDWVGPAGVAVAAGFQGWGVPI